MGRSLGDDVVAAAMIDRLVHHAEIIALKGDSYRLKDPDLGRVPSSATDEQINDQRGSTFSCRKRVRIQLPLTGRSAVGTRLPSKISDSMSFWMLSPSSGIHPLR